MKDQSKRSTGKVLKFNSRRGFGFIKPDDGGDDLFVHQTGIKSDGFRTLVEGDVVEFTVELSGEKYKACDVTSPGGGMIDAPQRDDYGNRDSFYEVGNRRSNRGGYGGRGVGPVGGAVCYNCGSTGHIARDCNPRRIRENGGGGCFNCGNSGHFVRDCPRATPNGGGGSSRNGGGGGVACFNCGMLGHLARDCRNVIACYNCGEQGHLARDCAGGRRGGGRFGGGGGGAGGNGGGRFGGDNGRCFNCGSEGHFARECPNNS